MKRRFWQVAILSACISLTGAESTPLPQPPAPAVPAAGTNAPALPDIAALQLPPELADIARLVAAGVAEQVVLDYIGSTPHAYHPTAEEIVHFNDLGASTNILSALIRKLMPVGATTNTPSIVPTNIAAAVPAAAPQIPNAPQVPMAPALPTPVTQTIVVQQPVVVQQPAVTVTHEYFYESLSPYGTWIYDGEFGHVWRPTVAVSVGGWRPYHQAGRWLYTDCGWYWQSDYSWGWAPFHYGRWHQHHRHGWVWTPDNVWGPAWVSWRTHHDYCGWAPLPPAARWRTGLGLHYHDRHVSVGFEFGLGDSHYTFLSWRHFNSRTPHHHYAAPAEAKQVFNNSTVVNNYISGDNNNVVINAGVRADPVVAATRQEVQRVRVREMTPDTARATIQGERLERSGGDLVLYRPPLTRPTPAAAAVSSRIETMKTRTALATGSQPAGAVSPRVERTVVQPARPAPVTVRPSAPRVAEAAPAAAPARPTSPTAIMRQNITRPVTPSLTTPTPPSPRPETPRLRSEIQRMEPVLLPPSRAVTRTAPPTITVQPAAPVTPQPFARPSAPAPAPAIREQPVFSRPAPPVAPAPAAPARSFSPQAAPAPALVRPAPVVIAPSSAPAAAPARPTPPSQPANSGGGTTTKSERSR